MMDSAGQVSHLSKKLVIAHRDWDSWDGETIMGCYYRARAVEAAVVYQRWIDLKHQQYIDHIIANFGDFPVRSRFRICSRVALTLFYL